MGEVKGFIKYKRRNFNNLSKDERIKNFNEFESLNKVEVQREQAARCMDCGIPFCNFACPIGNYIPDFNEMLHKGKYLEAYKLLERTNPFPEITGRVCPAPCENSCVVSINNPAVSIKNNERTIIEYAFENGFINETKIEYTGKTVAIVGSGPSGLAAAYFLNNNGIKTTVYEKSDAIGGLLANGIPNFKLDKGILKRRIDLMERTGVEFKTNCELGKDLTLGDIKSNYDAVLLTIGAEKPRNLDIKGRELKGVYFAMEYLESQAKFLRNNKNNLINAKGKNVIVIGGGDTGSDCIGTAIRQGAKKVYNIELLPKPPKERAADNPWPEWARVERISSSLEEGAKKIYSVLTKEFIGKEKVEKVKFTEVSWKNKREFEEIKNSGFELDADLVILALGFLGPDSSLTGKLGLAVDERGNIKTDNMFKTNIDGFFAAGDGRRGQSLVVWAINEGLASAGSIINYLNEKGSF